MCVAVPCRRTRIPDIVLFCSGKLGVIIFPWSPWRKPLTRVISSIGRKDGASRALQGHLQFSPLPLPPTSNFRVTLIFSGSSGAKSCAMSLESFVSCSVIGVEIHCQAVCGWHRCHWRCHLRITKKGTVQFWNCSSAMETREHFQNKIKHEHYRGTESNRKWPKGPAKRKTEKPQNQF